MSVASGVTMPVTVSWDDERQSILRWEYAGDWSWSDATVAADTTRNLLDNAPPDEPIALLLNLETMQTIPRDSLRNMRQLLHGLRPHDIVILCGDSVAVNVMIAFLRSIYRSTADQLYTAQNLQSGRMLALQLLAGYHPDDPTQSSRPNLPASP